MHSAAMLVNQVFTVHIPYYKHGPGTRMCKPGIHDLVIDIETITCQSDHKTSDVLV